VGLSQREQKRKTNLGHNAKRDGDGRRWNGRVIFGRRLCYGRVQEAESFSGDQEGAAANNLSVILISSSADDVDGFGGNKVV
jgi:hypothetical protein